ncbi:MAG: Holliday junction branch migration protein RuvA [Syntrophomonadaceae bacterium]|nr:Holliday junction branch migration protein RuvA [Syntrophomonadaceae bacterium]
MIAFVRGAVVEIGSESVCVEVNGIGYEVIVPISALNRLQGQQGRETMFHTYLQVLENEFKLYGFLGRNELELFKTLMGISGMGARTSLAVLGTMKPDEFYQAILAGDEKALTRVPGIGKKTAQRLLFELKGKVPEIEADMAGPVDLSTREETMLALEALGYSRSELYPILAQLERDQEMGERVEDNIKKILKIKGNLSK